MALIRNSLGATPAQPCGPDIVPFLGGCTDEQIKSWISAGNTILARIQETAGTLPVSPRTAALQDEAVDWENRWKALVEKLEGKSVLNPFGMNWGFGFAIIWTDTDAKLASAAVVEGADILERMGQKLPAQLDIEQFGNVSPTLTGADWFALGVTVTAVAVVGAGGYYLYKKR